MFLLLLRLFPCDATLIHHPTPKPPLRTCKQTDYGQIHHRTIHQQEHCHGTNIKHIQRLPKPITFHFHPYYQQSPLLDPTKRTHMSNRHILALSTGSLAATAADDPGGFVFAPLALAGVCFWHLNGAREGEEEGEGEDGRGSWGFVRSGCD